MPRPFPRKTDTDRQLLARPPAFSVVPPPGNLPPPLARINTREDKFPSGFRPSRHPAPARLCEPRKRGMRTPPKSHGGNSVSALRTHAHTQTGDRPLYSSRLIHRRGSCQRSLSVADPSISVDISARYSASFILDWRLDFHELFRRRRNGKRFVARGMGKISVCQRANAAKREGERI